MNSNKNDEFFSEKDEEGNIIARKVNESDDMFVKVRRGGGGVLENSTDLKNMNDDRNEKGLEGIEI
jgi:hypothetical protein